MCGTTDSFFLAGLERFEAWLETGALTPSTKAKITSMNRPKNCLRPCKYNLMNGCGYMPGVELKKRPRTKGCEFFVQAVFDKPEKRKTKQGHDRIYNYKADYVDSHSARFVGRM